MVNYLENINNKNFVDAIEKFPGIQHRMEFVCRFLNIRFFNDSKATNPDSASRSISLLKNIFLIAGGITKTDNISQIIPHITNIKKAYLYGRDAILLEKSFEKFVDCYVCDNIEQAFLCATNEAIDFEQESTVLLAPICASFDQFKNFEERGLAFKTLIENFIIRPIPKFTSTRNASYNEIQNHGVLDIHENSEAKAMHHFASKVELGNGPKSKV